MNKRVIIAVAVAVTTIWTFINFPRDYGIREGDYAYRQISDTEVALTKYLGTAAEITLPLTLGGENGNAGRWESISGYKNSNSIKYCKSIFNPCEVSFIWFKEHEGNQYSRYCSANRRFINCE